MKQTGRNRPVKPEHQAPKAKMWNRNENDRDRKRRRGGKKAALWTVCLVVLTSCSHQLHLLIRASRVSRVNIKDLPYSPKWEVICLDVPIRVQRSIRHRGNATSSSRQQFTFGRLHHILSGLKDDEQLNLDMIAMIMQDNLEAAVKLKQEATCECGDLPGSDQDVLSLCPFLCNPRNGIWDLVVKIYYVLMRRWWSGTSSCQLQGYVTCTMHRWNLKASAKPSLPAD